MLIDFYSDTHTRPTPAMRRFMCEAEVGDEQMQEDPSVNRLQETVAELLGKEAALYLPSGTMCNEIAFAVHCRAGDEIIMDRTAHAFHYEAGAPAALAGASVRLVNGVRGVFDAPLVAAAVRAPIRLHPRSRLVSVENTSNLGGGTCWPLERIKDVTAEARRHGLATHLDGARLLNAVVATGIAARTYAASFDSAWIDLTKGLGCPVGAVLAGTQGFIEEAWYWKHRLGGAMRQAGIVAAAGIYALEHHIDRLAEDHANARRLALGLAAIPGVRLDPATVETNIVLFDLDPDSLSAAQLHDRLLADHHLRVSVTGERRVRMITHLDVGAEDVTAAVAAVRGVLEGR